ncbi:MAG: DNA-binding protein [Methylophaga sp.]|nr:DNA-binding protein [Methylophaga sp.]
MTERIKEFEFTLKFSMPDTFADPESFADQLRKAGCDDAIIGIGQKGRIALQFNREASRALEAITSAIKDVKSVIPDARLIESTPDLVGLTDIAQMLGFSRQNMRNLVLTHIQTFPAPVHSGTTSIWHLCNVLEWFEIKQHRAIEATIKEVALANMEINLVKEYANLEPASQAKLAALTL